jgi:VanZ family protein
MNKFKTWAWLLNITILVLSLAPIGEQIPKPLERSDLIYHGIAYALICLLFLFSYKNKKIMVTTSLIAQGVAIEFLQPYFMRHFEYLDMAANSLGVAVGLILFQSFKVFSSTKSTGPSK